MTWTLEKITPNPLQASVTVRNDDRSAGLTTDYHSADALARRVLGEATLAARHYGFDGHARRTYASQAY